MLHSPYGGLPAIALGWNDPKALLISFVCLPLSAKAGKSDISKVPVLESVIDAKLKIVYNKDKESAANFACVILIKLSLSVKTTLVKSYTKKNTLQTESHVHSTKKKKKKKTGNTINEISGKLLSLT